MKRLLSVLVTLGLVMVALVAVGPSQRAEASVTWPQELSDTGITQVVAHGDDNLSLLSCNYTSIPSTNAFTNVINGVESSSYPQNGTFGCDPRRGGNGGQLNGDITNPDGTVYGTYADSSTSPTTVYLVAVKNGRLKWRTSLNYDSGCAGFAGVGRMPTSMSIGADGNLYMIEADGQYNPYCNQYLLGVDTQTGAIIDRVNLGKYNGSYQGVKPSVWTYSDKIVTVDVGGEIHQYGYDYVEVTGAHMQYQFPGSPASGTVMANSAGDVYLISDCGGNIYSHSPDGTTGSVARTDGCSGAQQTFTVGPVGDVVGYYHGGAIYNYHVSLGTYSTHSPSIPSGYSVAQVYYTNPYLIEDGSGNIAEVVQLKQDGTNHPAVDVLYIDASTNSSTSLYMMTGEGFAYGDATGNAIAGQPDVYGGYMYLPVAHGDTGGLSTNTHSYVEKVALGSFGSAVRLINGFGPGTGTKLNYVAMGDSYSSGEGNPDFEFGTDTATNKCHRSSLAYPRLLASESGSNLNLTDFVACSGATTDDVLNGGSSTGSWGEPAQVGALNSNTDVVTLTIGGNDAGFSVYMTYCITSFCGPVTNASYYGTFIGIINSSAFTSALKTTYETILNDAPNAQVYVSEYPYITSESETLCDAVDVSGVYGLTTELNSVIDAAVGTVAESNANLHLVSANASGSPFVGKNVCGSDPYFNNDILAPLSSQVYSYHPNADGQIAFKNLFKDVMPQS